MRERLSRVEHTLAIARTHRRTVGVVQRALDEIARGQQIFQPLLILDADGVAAEIIRDPHGGDIHFALQANLRVGEIALVLRAGVEFHPLLLQPRAHGVGLGIRHAHRLGVKRGLAEAFLENSARVQRVIGYDGVEHAHAALVENAEDRFFAAELRGKFLAELRGARWHAHFLQRTRVRGVVRDATRLEPLPQFCAEKVVREIFAPQRRVAHTGLRERTVEVQHADEPRPLAAPIRDSQNRPAMRREPGEDVMRILPHRLGDDERRIGIHVAENFEAELLRINEAVLRFRIERMRAHDADTLGGERVGEQLFHRSLRRPADLICGEPQIATGDQLHGVFREAFCGHGGWGAGVLARGRCFEMTNDE